MRTRMIGGVLAVVAAVSLAAGCSSSSSPSSGSAPTSTVAGAPGAEAVSPQHNAADVAFAQGMIPHHAQAISMAGQASSRASSPEVKDLATKISGAQGPEIDLMNSMLAAWGAPTVAPNATGMPAMPGMAPGSSMPGMMSDGEMSQLSTLSGPAFDKSFLSMMIQHHSGAIQMAQTEQAQGENPQAKDLAGRIIADQQQEIGQMRAMLGRV
jgi:uncharacterized protein (DUF305 family)